jgi:hypothetical protein
MHYFQFNKWFKFSGFKVYEFDFDLTLTLFG